MKSDALTTLAATLPRPSPRPDRAQAIVELGVEPPIRIGDQPVDSPERRRISLRWLAGAALTGLSGVALIGSALYLGLDSQYNFADAPEFASPAHRETGESEGVSEGKGDRLVRPVDVVAAKQTYKASTTIKVGDKEVVKVRAFTHLADDADHHADRLRRRRPAVQSAEADQRGDRAGRRAARSRTGAGRRRGHLSRTRLRRARMRPTVAGELTLADAQAQVAELMKAAATRRDRAAQLPPQFLLMHSSQATPDPFGLLGYAAVGNVGPAGDSDALRLDRSPDGAGKRHQRRQGGAGKRGNQRRTARRACATANPSRICCAPTAPSKEAAAAILAAFGAKRGESPVDEGQKIILQYEDPPARASRRRSAASPSTPTNSSRRRSRSTTRATMCR